MTIDYGLLAPVRAGTAVARLVSDDAWVGAMLEVEIALARVQARLGIIPAEVPDCVAVAVRTGRFDGRVLAEEARGAANPVVALVQWLQRTVAQVDSASADYVHWGATSQDIFDTATMLIAARALSVIVDDLNETIAALVDSARAHRNTPAVARTLAMHAVPTTFGAKLAVWAQGVVDARDRVCQVRTYGLPVALSGAAGTFASYVECARVSGGELATAPAAVIHDRLNTELAVELGLTSGVMPWHTVRTPIADLAGSLAMVTGALGRFAIDVITLSRTEIRELAEPGAVGRGESSAMPQKRNPVLATMIRTAALQMPGLVSTLFTTMLAEDERSAGLWHAEWQPLRECLALAGGSACTARELAGGLIIDSQHVASNLALGRGQVASERLVIRLTPLLGRVRTKKLLQSASFEANSTGQALAEVLSENPIIRSHLDADAIAELLCPENYLGIAPDLAARVRVRPACACSAGSSGSEM